MTFRKLDEQEIQLLEKQGCYCSNWNLIEVHPKFTANNIHRVIFSGVVKIGLLSGTFELPGGIVQNSGLKDVKIHHCEIGNHVFIDRVHNYIANYKIGDYSYIQNVHCIYVEGESSFGNGTSVAVMNEQGGREVVIYDYLNAHFAYILTFYRHRPLLIEKLQQMVKRYTASIRSSMGTIGEHVSILNTGAIKNVRIGNYTRIEGAQLLENGSINSNFEAPVHIGYSVVANNFIISSGVKITDGVMLNRCFVGQACRLGHTYSATDSLFFSNCLGENGEAASLFAGPYTVTHHKSTLLISGMFSFMNAGSGSNQSNHMYKLGAIHQGIVERGGKTTSNSYILWPARIGAFSLIMGRHTGNSDTSNMPFSYLIEHDNQTVLVPAVNLRSVGTIRDAQKFPKRDKRTDTHPLDFLNFNLLSPYTIQKMLKGIDILEKLKHTCGETSKTYGYQGCVMDSKSVYRGIALYHMAVKKFLGNSIISRLTECPCTSNEEIRAYLKPDSNVGLGEWRDLAGLIVPHAEIIRLLISIEKEEVRNSKEIYDLFKKWHEDYYSLEWTWAWSQIKLYYQLDLESIIATDVIHIVEEWKKAVVDLDHMIYEDARKEFSLSSRISFGLDGNRYVQQVDFEKVRGVFEENDFVKTVLKHIEVKSALGEELIGRLQKCQLL